MDQPTARRRRHASSANSVTVAELQAKSTPAEQASVSAIQARAVAEANARTPPHGRPALPVATWQPAVGYLPVQVDAATEPTRIDDAADEHGTSNRLARTIVVTLVVMVVFGAVTAVAALGGGRPHRLSPSAPVIQPAVMTGPEVVRPDVLIKQLTSGEVAGIPADGSSGATQGQPSGRLADRDVAAGVITSFYEALPVHTEQAFNLLGPTMQTDGLLAFDGGWLGTRSVESRVLPDDDEEQQGGLRVAVSIERLDGTVLRLMQRVEVMAVRVDGTPQPRIVSVQLLSAHRG